MRLRDWLRSWSKAERHRRRAERDRLAPLHDLSPTEQADVFAMGQLVHRIKTGEFPLIEAVIAPEPIGPCLPTVDERYALFAADPLTAELPGEPAKHNAFYADLLDQQPISDEVRRDLESKTGSWTAEYMKELIERGKR